MVDAYLPEDVTLTINGSDFTTTVFQYEEGGGGLKKTYRPTLHRKFKKSVSYPESYSISFGATVVDDGFEKVFTNGMSGSVTLDFNGSLTIDYSELSINKTQYSMTADDRLVVTAELVAPVYDFNGSFNRRVF